MILHLTSTLVQISSLNSSSAGRGRTQVVPLLFAFRIDVFGKNRRLLFQDFLHIGIKISVRLKNDNHNLDCVLST